MKTLIMILMIMVLATSILYGNTSDQPPQIPLEEQPEVLTRGPINEAFAHPINMETASGFVVQKAPPPDIEEIPPEEMLAGDEFAWAPGYWAWDSDRNEHIWVSGCWRAVPPGKYWVIGYWAEVANGWRWVEGFWAPVSNSVIEYLPRPPAVTYVDPPVTTAPDKIWVPPCWYWSYNRYTLRSGYWIEARENWVWVPSNYVWSPHGYVFVKGHWDYPFQQRGVLFAPVHFPANIYTRVRYPYSLSIAINIGNLEFGLFTRPKYRHYYFGDYYDSFYVGIGIYPWFESVTRHTWYDPIYLHDRWRHRKSEPRWHHRQKREYARRRADKKFRPPRTYREMKRRGSNIKKSKQRNFKVAEPMRRLGEKKTTTLRPRKNKPESKRQIKRYTNDVKKYARERSKRESPVTVRKSVRSVMKSVPSQDHRKMRASVVRKRQDIKPSERRRSSHSERVSSVEVSPRGWKRSTALRSQEKPLKVSQREQEQEKSDNVKVRTSTVVKKKKGRSARKRTPSQSAKERATRNNRR